MLGNCLARWAITRPVAPCNWGHRGVIVGQLPTMLGVCQGKPQRIGSTTRGDDACCSGPSALSRQARKQSQPVEARPGPSALHRQAHKRSHLVQAAPGPIGPVHGPSTWIIHLDTIYPDIGPVHSSLFVLGRRGLSHRRAWLRVSLEVGGKR